MEEEVTYEQAMKAKEVLLGYVCEKLKNYECCDLEEKLRRKDEFMLYFALKSDYFLN